ncbi:MAG: hypothetical protein PHO56_00375 [Patescibacteria group bacterium]|nr:hypothetical protein [Patescibacteria group bacterium]
MRKKKTKNKYSKITLSILAASGLILAVSFIIVIAARPSTPNPATMNQYGSSTSTPVANGSFIKQNQINLYATSTDSIDHKQVVIYYQLATTSGTFISSTSTPATVCTSGTAYASCPSRVWGPSVSGGGGGAMTWKGPLTITAGTNATTTGTALYAYDWSNTSQTVNGVSFTGTASLAGSGDGNITFTTSADSIGTDGSTIASYNGIIAHFAAFTSAGSGNRPIVLHGLTGGHTYKVQFWSSTASNASFGNQTFTDTNSVTMNAAAPLPGQFVAGTFAATGATETIDLHSGFFNFLALNAVEVRDMSVSSEPKYMKFTAVPDGSYKWQALACTADGCSHWSAFNAVTPNLTIDTTKPTTPGNLTLSKKNASAITIKFGATSTDANFYQYKIYYKAGVSGVHQTDTAFGSSTNPGDTVLQFANLSHHSTTTVTGLNASTTYVFNIWAYDKAGNLASGTTEFVQATDNPIPTIVSISPSSKTVGDAQFTLTVNGSNFVSASQVKFNGSNRTTTFVNSTQLTAIIPATDMLTATNTVQLTIFNPTPGGGTSNAQTFTVNNPVPTTVSISPNTKIVGDAQFTMTIKGTNFVNTSVVRFNGSNLTTAFSSSTQLTVTIPAADMLKATGTAQLTVFNPTPGGGTSNAQTFTVNNPVPATTDISPTFKTVGDAQFTLTVNGSNFVSTSQVKFNGSNRTTTFVSASQLTAIIPATDMLTATNTIQVSVTNPTPGGGTSNSQTFTVNNPVPTTVSISPSGKIVGNTQFTMTVKGTNFVNTSVVRFNGSNRTTTFASSTQLTATIPAADLLTATNTVQITVTNPAPGGGTSNAQIFTVNNPVPAMTNIFPAAKIVGDAQFTMTVNGSNFVNSSVVRFNGSDRATAFVSDNQLTVIIPASDLTAPSAMTQITVFNPAPGGGTSNAEVFTINNPIPATTSISPTFKTVGDAQFTLTVNGSNFVSASQIKFNGSNRTTAFVSSTSLTAVIPATDLLTATNTAQITVFNPTPGGGTSNAQTFTVNNPVPATTDISPTFKTVGDAQFILTVNGSNFVLTSQVKFNGSNRATTYVSANQLTAIIPATDMLTATNTVQIAVTNPTPGGGTSNAQTFTVNNPVPATTNISPTSKTVGDAQFTLTVNGSNFVSTSQVKFNSSNRTTTFVSTNQVTAIIPASDLTVVTSTVQITVTNPTPGGGTSNAQIFSVNNLPATKFVILQPANGTVDAPITVTVEAQDASNNVVTAYQQDVTLSTDGSATGGGLVNIVNGIGTTTISDQVAETAHLSLSDTQLTGLIVSSTKNVIFAAGVPTQFSLNNPGDISAGDRAAYVISRLDQYGNLTAQGNTTVYLYSTSNGAHKAFYDASVNGSVITSLIISSGNSSADFWYYDEKAGNWMITVSDNSIAPDGNAGIDDASDAIAVSPGPTSQFTLNNPGGMTAGTRLGYLVGRQDQYGNGVTSGSETVYLYSDSAGANKKFYNAASGGSVITSADIGSGASSTDFWYYDDKAGNWDVTVSDNSSAPDGITGINDAAVSVLVNAAVTNIYTLNHPGDMTAGTLLGYTVNRADQFGNSVASGNDLVYLYSNSSPVTPIFYATDATSSPINSVAITNGNSTADFWYSDKNAGSWTITGSDNSSTPDGAAGIIDGTDTVNVVAAPIMATKFIIINPVDGTVGDHISVTIEAVDNSNNIDTTYQNDVTLSADGSASGAGLVNIVNGVGTKVITDIVAETVDLSLSDTQSTGLNVSSAQDLIFATGPVDKFILNNPSGITAGTRAGYTITREDQYGNTVLTGNTTVYLYSDSSGVNKKFYDMASGGSAISLINIPPGNSGAHVWYYDDKAGNWTITVSDNAVTPDGSAGIADASDVLAVSPDAAARFVLNNPGDMSAGTRLGYQAMRQDQFANPVTAGSNIIYLYSNSTGTTTKFFDAASNGNQITSTALSSGSSAADFWYFDDTPGTWTISASDNSIAPDGAAGIIDGSDSVTVSTAPITAAKFVILNPVNGTVGDNITVTVEAQDNSGNIDTSYQQDVTLITSGSATGGGLVNIVNGVGAKIITDAVAETVNLTLSDSQSTGLNVSSAQNVIFAAAGGPPPVNPPSVPPTAGGGLVSKPLAFTISGQAFPGAKIFLSQISSQGISLVKDAGTASADGGFSISTTGFSSGGYTFSLIVQDKNGFQTQAKIYNFSFSITPVEIDNVVVPPTIDLLRSVLTRGDFIKVIGFAAPNNEVTAQLDNGKTYSIKAGVSGAYQILINTAALPYGNHSVVVWQTDHDSGLEGDRSLTRNFLVSPLTAFSVDYNNDGKIDIQDWSIFLTLWQQQDKRADLNGDGKFDISDFSIFLADYNNYIKIDVQNWSIFLTLWQQQDKRADLNGDGKFDVVDLSIYLQTAKIK